jgi:hypothetical protein
MQLSRDELLLILAAFDFKEFTELSQRLETFLFQLFRIGSTVISILEDVHMENELKGHIIHTEKVAHVTFTIRQIVPDIFDLYSESEGKGWHRLEWGVSYDTALTRLQQEIVSLESALENKRSSIPTQKQLHFLFRNKVSIPPDLTWGQASDIINEKIAQIEIERDAMQEQKREKQIKDFHGLWVGKRLICKLPINCPTREVAGEVFKLTYNNRREPRYVYIRFDDGKSFYYDVDDLPDMVEEALTL